MLAFTDLLSCLRGSSSTAVLDEDGVN